MKKNWLFLLLNCFLCVNLLSQDTSFSKTVKNEEYAKMNFAPPENDECQNAIDISEYFLFGQVTNTPVYSNVEASSSISDPAFGWECFSEPNGTGSMPNFG